MMEADTDAPSTAAAVNTRLGAPSHDGFTARHSRWMNRGPATEEGFSSLCLRAAAHTAVCFTGRGAPAFTGDLLAL